MKKSELESILTLLDAESERILDGYGGSGVLYGGMQEDAPSSAPALTTTDVPIKVNKSLAGQIHFAFHCDSYVARKYIHTSLLQ